VRHAKVLHRLSLKIGTRDLCSSEMLRSVDWQLSTFRDNISTPSSSVKQSKNEFREHFGAQFCRGMCGLWLGLRGRDAGQWGQWSMVDSEEESGGKEKLPSEYPDFPCILLGLLDL
jgi:hypothetical protein